MNWHFCVHQPISVTREFCQLSKWWQSFWPRNHDHIIHAIHAGSPLGYSHHNDVIKWKPFPWPFVRNSQFPGEFPAQRPVTRSFDVFFDLRLNKRLSKQSWGWWFETLSRTLWRQCDDWQTCYRETNPYLIHLSIALLCQMLWGRK